jgi:very-short-patch-repair endonuclease
LSSSIDARIAAIAARQHGVVARRQLIGIGLGKHAIDHRVAIGRLHGLYRGVYIVGHPTLSVESKWMAAVLACGSGAVLSYRSAATLWGIRRTTRSLIEVTARRGRHPRPGIQLHQDRLQDSEITVRDCIPVTTPMRTLLDLAAVLDRHQLERSVNEAEVLRCLDVLTLERLLRRYPNRAGIAVLRRLLAARTTGITRSELENLFLGFLDRYSLPAPDLNFPLQLGNDWIEVDCVWRDERVIVELDGHRTHGTRAAFERDRKRDRALQAKGWRVVRVTWRQLRDEPDSLAADLRRLLAQGEVLAVVA